MLAATFLSAIYLSLHGVYSAAFERLKTEDLPQDSQEVLSPIIPEVNDEAEAASGSEPLDTESTNSSIAVSGGQAEGKITAKFFSPYTANTAYSKVYLKNNTEQKIDLASLLSKKLSFKISNTNEPQVLILHTHTTESYMLHENDYYTLNDSSRTTDESLNMIAIGEVFKNELTKAGIGVIHDKTVHDYPSYTGSYSRSAKSVKADLQANKSIKVVIDLHRDAITGDNKEKFKPIAEINGKKYAQVMLVMGSETGGISGHPNWLENLSLAAKYQQTMEVKYPGLARFILLNSAKYNQNLSNGYLLLEVGSEANTLTEAKNSAAAAAECLAQLLKTAK